MNAGMMWLGAGMVWLGMLLVMGIERYEDWFCQGGLRFRLALTLIGGSWGLTVGGLMLFAMAPFVSMKG